MRGRERQNTAEESGNSNAWMTTFADLIMLLLTFFVLLLTMSSLSREGLKELTTYLRESVGVLEFSGLSKIDNLASFVKSLEARNTAIIIDYKELSRESLPGLEAVRKAIGAEADASDLFAISRDERGVSLSFHANIFFKSGMATISRESYPLLDIIATAIADSPNDIIIMGHTDKTPVKKGRYRSNLELSAYRGMTILDYFTGKKNLDADRFAVGGYGSWRPYKPNSSRIGNPANRRVEIIFKSIREN